MLSIKLILGGIVIMLVTGLGVFTTKKADNPENKDTKTEPPALVTKDGLSTATSTSPEEVVSNNTNTEPTDDSGITPNEESFEDIEVKSEESEILILEESPKPVVDEEIDYSSYGNFVEVEDLKNIDEKDINIKAIVLVRCMYTSQYYGETAAIDDEFMFTTGTGFFVNSDGTILTAGHVVRKKTREDGSSDRIWSLKKCQIARTKSIWDEIRSTDKRFRGAETHFEDIDIVYEPSDDIYLDANGVDIAVLKLKESDGDNSYFELVPQMVNLKTDEYGPVVVGYPGKSIIMQTMERATSFFYEIEAIKGSRCKEKDYTTPCGWRYTLVRDLNDFKAFGGLMDWDLGFYTILGRESTNMRGGFSGSPVLVNGNVIGILTSGSVQSDAGFDTKGTDVMHALTSYDIVEQLKTDGVSF